MSKTGTVICILVCLTLIVTMPNVLAAGRALLEETSVESEFMFVEPKEVSRDAAFNALLAAEEDMREMKEFDLSTYFIRDTLLKAKRSFIGEDTAILESEIAQTEEGPKKYYLGGLLVIANETLSYEVEPLNYTNTIMLAQLINFRKKQAYEILDVFDLISEKEKGHAEQGMDTTTAKNLLEEARLSFKDERYDEAAAYLEEADLELDKLSGEQTRVSGITKLGRNFFERNWQWLLIILVVLAIITHPSIKRGRKVWTKKKLKRLRLELDTLNKLLKKAQEDYFVHKKLSTTMFNIRSEKYKKRIAQVKHTIPVLESIVEGKKRQKKEEFKPSLEIKKE